MHSSWSGGVPPGASHVTTTQIRTENTSYPSPRFSGCLLPMWLVPLPRGLTDREKERWSLGEMWGRESA